MWILRYLNGSGYLKEQRAPTLDQIQEILEIEFDEQGPFNFNLKWESKK